MFNALTVDVEERAQVHRFEKRPGTSPGSRESPIWPPFCHATRSDADGGLPAGFLRKFSLSQSIRPHVTRGAHVKAMIATLTLEIELNIEKARRS